MKTCYYCHKSGWYGDEHNWVSDKDNYHFCSPYCRGQYRSSEKRRIERLKKVRK
jgi:hypothetical protein